VFVSLSDNIQETFGLVITEAMASGLPVVASDWNGYRDMLVHGESGYLVPTAMTTDATVDLTSRLLMGEMNYDHFLAECSQTVAVDIGATADALTRLIEDDGLRARMGAAGRQRAVERFAWSHVIRGYETLWASQEAERLETLASAGKPSAALLTPACYPPPETSFGGYSTRVLADSDQVVSVPGGDAELDRLLSHPLTNHSAERRADEISTYRAVLYAARAPRRIADLDGLLFHAGVTHQAGRATIAWMLKYGLLRIA
jgi:hypothetical protein